MLIRSLHLELTLENLRPNPSENYLLDHIDSSIARITGKSFSAISFDRNIEMGFTCYKKMKTLFELLKQVNKKEVGY